MREFFRYCFLKSDSRKNSERAVMAKIAVGIIGIIACLGAMSITAVAFFSFNISSNSNIIKSASYTLDITPPESMAVSDSYLLDNSTGDTEKKFTFKISVSAEATASVGFCEINVKTDTDAVQTFYTKPIWTNTDAQYPERLNSRMVEITVMPYKTATVSFISQWGSCAFEDLVVDTAVEPEYLPHTPALKEEEQAVNEEEKQETEQQNQTEDEEITVQTEDQTENTENQEAVGETDGEETETEE